MEKISNINVRLAARDDIPNIFKMIQELADFEEMPNGPKITSEILERDAFDVSPPLYRCYIAELNEETSPLSKPIGYALFFNTYSTWEGKSLMLEDLYVKPNWRLMGVGKKLFQAVAKYALDTSCCRLDFHVLKWNPARKMYECLGATNITDSEEWLFYRLSKEAMLSLTAGDKCSQKLN